MLYATDTVSLGDVRVSDSGYLEAFARTARTGVQQYLGAEMGRPDLGVVNVYRDAADVFSHASLHSFAKIPVTVDHPPTGVSAVNWKQVAVGTTGEEVLRDGERLKIGLKIMDAAAISAVQAGKRELSVGYRTEIQWGDGIAPDGTAYQARQTNIVADHIAIVARGRAGETCRIGDAWTPTETKPAPEREIVPMKTHMIGDHAVEMSDAAVIAVKGLQSQLGILTADNLKLTADLTRAGENHVTAMSAKDVELTTINALVELKDGEIAALKQQVSDAELTPAKLDAAVAIRGKIVSDAKKIAGEKLVVDGKTNGEIQRAAVVARIGDAAVAFSDEAVTGAFASLASQPVHMDAFRTVVTTGTTTVQTGDAAGAYEAMKTRLSNQYAPKTA